MRAVVQRVTEASVEVDGTVVGQIGPGLLVYVSVGQDDSYSNAEALAKKVGQLRIFEDEGGKMNLSVLDIGAQVLVISNFTLHGDCRKGRRPSFDGAGERTKAKKLYEEFAQLLKGQGVSKVECGVFGAHMHVESVNDGPVTFALEL